MPPSLTRRRFLGLLVPACGFGLAKGMGTEGLDVRLADGLLRVSAPKLKFVTGQPLERLQNGAPVPFAFQLAVSTDRWASVLSRDIERFVFSYDLWEEKFAVARMGHPRKSVSHLSARAAEAWCVDELSLAPAGIGPEQPFWVRLDVRAENPAEQAELDRQESMSLTRLIEIFSRRTRGEQNRWTADGGPFRLSELRNNPRAGLPGHLSMDRGEAR
jgi:hypothetical protein